MRLTDAGRHLHEQVNLGLTLIDEAGGLDLAITVGRGDCSRNPRWRIFKSRDEREG
ncbi:MAG TPA: hypothetical protein VJ673_02165 [Aromatoleum sp.]|uniref:hypothetical protein n=1 Tax=Aromatoleum sp. TaxID=2307007 RepID=UPI002B4A3E81|nr:hypothetical protein [Aromatoleum sp.]HJV24455.1 hypothetical protein [Aromatoleum sp.]